MTFSQYNVIILYECGNVATKGFHQHHRNSASYDLILLAQFTMYSTFFTGLSTIILGLVCDTAPSECIAFLLQPYPSESNFTSSAINKWVNKNKLQVSNVLLHIWVYESKGCELLILISITFSWEPLFYSLELWEKTQSFILIFSGQIYFYCSLLWNGSSLMEGRVQRYIGRYSQDLLFSYWQNMMPAHNTTHMSIL